MDALSSIFFEFVFWLIEATLYQRGFGPFLTGWVLIAYALWDRYVLIMALYRAHLNKRLHGINKALAYPNVVIGFLLDVLVNMTWATLVFREFPREWLVTSRLQRHINDERHSWRKERARYWCEQVLDPLDPTDKHC